MLEKLTRGVERESNLRKCMDELEPVQLLVLSSHRHQVGRKNTKVKSQFTTRDVTREATGTSSSRLSPRPLLLRRS